MMKLPELLAPAGSWDAMVAAVAAGADAVYLSGKRFGARKYASNFDQDELKAAVDYAHIRGVKLYVTVNTLIRDDELSDVSRYLEWLYEIGTDAVLVQDIGVATLARQVVPELDLHASTQMTIHNRPGAVCAQRLGMKRVVLAREVSIDEAREIGWDLNIGLEVFVHGALCYCYSGQCLLSSVIGGRSGNRGMCAQPCRKPCVLQIGEKDEYGRPINLSAAPIRARFLMSTRDLAVYDQLDKVVKSPIESLKIEGRMKSAQYVAIVTNIYRNALDAIAKGKWCASEEDQRDLALAFNRNFTSGYLMGSRDIMGKEMSDNRGFLLGAVTAYDPKREETTIRLNGSLELEKGDGLVFQSPDQELGMIVHRSPWLKDGLMRLKTPKRVKPGARVYLTSSSRLSRRAEEIVSGAPLKIPIDLVVHWEDNVPVAEGMLRGPQGSIKIQVRAGFQMEKALKKPLTREQIEGQLRRTGGTPFQIRKVEMRYPGGLFSPLGALNQLRRDFLEKAEAALIDAKRPDPQKIAAARERLDGLDLAAAGLPQGRIPSLAIYVDSLEAVQAVAKAGCGRIYFEPRFKVERPSELADELNRQLSAARSLCGSSQLIWKWPRITKDGYLKFAASVLNKTEVEGIMVEGIGAAEAAAAARPGIALFGSFSLQVWNHLTVALLKPIFKLLTLSPELSQDQLAELMAKARLNDAPEMELLVQGTLEVMISEDCLPCVVYKDAAKSDIFFGLQDFKRLFPLWVDNDSRTHISNAVETCLVDYLPKLFEIGLDGIAIDARCRTRKYAAEMCMIYLEAIDLTRKGGITLENDLNSLKEKARAISLGGITTGHFIKGLKDELPNLG
jgi:putative protease